MRYIYESWRRFLTEEDTSTVAKVVLVDENNHVLFLKRTDYTDKFKGEWDLPGGHIKSGESLMDGLIREVEEETGLTIRRARLFTKQGNLHFFESKYEKGNIILSNEHSEHKFIDPLTIQNPSKFEKIAQEVVKNA